MSFSDFLNEENEFKTITIEVRDPNNNLQELIDYIKGIGNIGHSFEIVVDPNDKGYRKEFFWDGDGPDYIKNIKVK